MLVSFDLPITGQELSQWRGAFIEMAGFEHDLLHNHNGNEGYHHRYPLIQYRIKDGKAAIFATQDGVEALQRALASSDWQLRWKDKPHMLQVEDLRMQKDEVQLLNQPRHYQTYRAQLLNTENFQKWQAAEGMIERAALLEKQVGNYVMVALWALGWEEKGNVVVKLQQIRHQQPVRCMGKEVLAFDLTFSANVVLPELIGLGRSVSHGYGWTVQQRTKQKPKQERFRHRAAEQDRQGVQSETFEH
jgi:hypothetical protein